MEKGHVAVTGKYRDREAVPTRLVVVEEALQARSALEHIDHGAPLRQVLDLTDLVGQWTDTREEDLEKKTKGEPIATLNGGGIIGEHAVRALGRGHGDFGIRNPESGVSKDWEIKTRNQKLETFCNRTQICADDTRIYADTRCHKG